MRWIYTYNIWVNSMYPIYIRYKRKNIAPSNRVISPFFQKKNKNTMSSAIAKSSTDISIISAGLTGKFATIPVIQSTNSILKILLQTIFQIAISA